jgi:hypothetical protein
MSDQEFKPLYDALIEAVQEINQKVSLLLEKQSEIISSKSSIQYQDDAADVVDELISKFYHELRMYQIDFDFDANYNQNDIKNRASYYFENKVNITSPRAYLSKVVSQIKPVRPDPAKSEVSEPDKKMSAEYAEMLLYRFNELTEQQINKVKFDNEKVMWMINGIDRSRYSQFHKIMITETALRTGVLS